jgi:hypothetical protein
MLSLPSAEENYMFLQVRSIFIGDRSIMSGVEAFKAALVLESRHGSRNPGSWPYFRIGVAIGVFRYRPVNRIGGAITSTTCACQIRRRSDDVGQTK